MAELSSLLICAVRDSAVAQATSNDWAQPKITICQAESQFVSILFWFCYRGLNPAGCAEPNGPLNCEGNLCYSEVY